MIKKVWRVGDSLMVSMTREEAEKLGIQEGDPVDVPIQKIGMRAAMRPEVRAALEQAAIKLASDLEYLKDQ